MNYPFRSSLVVSLRLRLVHWSPRKLRSARSHQDLVPSTPPKRWCLGFSGVHAAEKRPGAVADPGPRFWAPLGFRVLVFRCPGFKNQIQ